MGSSNFFNAWRFVKLFKELLKMDVQAEPDDLNGIRKQLVSCLPLKLKNVSFAISRSSSSSFVLNHILNISFVSNAWNAQLDSVINTLFKASGIKVEKKTFANNEKMYTITAKKLLDYDVSIGGKAVNPEDVVDVSL